MKLYKFNVVYNANFWGSRKASGYVFAETIFDAREKLEKEYGEVDYSDMEQSTVVDYNIVETDIIKL